MSDTPRTDELLNTITENTLPDVFGAQLIEHALSLERELATAIEQRDKAMEWVRGTLGTAHLKEMADYIKEKFGK